ncbi:MAG: hypothetical protein Q9209_006825 [Squamulea sp. 1 TL-2023]
MDDPLWNRLVAAEQRIAAAEQRAEEAEKANAKSAFPKYLQACHQYLHCPVRIQPNESFTTTGQQVVPNDKYYPDKFALWDEFLRLSKVILSQKHDAVEAHVTAIVKELAQLPKARTKYNLADGVSFEYEPESVSDAAQTPYSTTESARDVSEFEEEKDRTRADQYCVRQEGENTQRLIQIREYKTPHNMTSDIINTGFRSMVTKEVLLHKNQPPIVHSNNGAAGKKQKRQRHMSEATKESFQDDADCMVTAVVIQVFHYMIACGLSYSYIATGIALVFLYIDYKNPATLQYHVSEPYHAHENLPSNLTAVGQVLAMTLLASLTDQKPQALRTQVREGLSKTARYSFKDVVHGLFLNIVNSSDSNYSNEHGTTRHKKKKHKDKGSDSSPSPNPRITRAKCKEQRAAAEDLDKYCEPLGLSGARDFLFRVTLASHGYVFVAKGTTGRLRPRLRHEEKIFEHLKALQGTTIPVHLGNINLVHRYFLDWHPIKHFLLLSWGGDHAPA